MQSYTIHINYSYKIRDNTYRFPNPQQDQWKISGDRLRIVNGIKNKNIKNSLGAKWNASHLAVRLIQASA